MQSVEGETQVLLRILLSTLTENAQPSALMRPRCQESLRSNATPLPQLLLSIRTGHQCAHGTGEIQSKPHRNAYLKSSVFNYTSYDYESVMSQHVSCTNGWIFVHLSMYCTIQTGTDWMSPVHRLKCTDENVEFYIKPVSGNRWYKVFQFICSKSLNTWKCGMSGWFNILNKNPAEM